MREHILAHDGHVTSVAFSPDGGRLLTTGLSDRSARIWDTASWSEFIELKGHQAAVLHASFSPDGTQVVTASSDGTARVWDSYNGFEIMVLRGHEGAVTSAAFSPDGVWVVTGSLDTTARLWPVLAAQGSSSTRPAR